MTTVSTENFIYAFSNLQSGQKTATPRNILVLLQHMFLCARFPSTDVATKVASTCCFFFGHHGNIGLYMDYGFDLISSEVMF